MAYIKKPEYGPARLEARGLTLRAVGRLAKVQEGSSVTIDGVPQSTEKLDVSDLYDGYMRK
jgi:hypothetical protein